MALNVALQLYRGTKSDLSSLASTGKVGVVAYTTDTQEIYVDSGSGTGIGPGNAWLRIANDITVSTAANQAARLALTNQLIGDLCVETDTSTTYILVALPASTNANWVAIGLSAAPVSSVFGRTGAVVATSGDYSFSLISGTLAESQLPASIGSGSNLTSVDLGTF